MRQRIALILAAALALGGAALIPGAHLFLTGREEAVTVEEEILYGDPAAAQGLQVTLGVECGVGGTDLLSDATAATERSMPPVMSTIVMPTALMPM